LKFTRFEPFSEPQLRSHPLSSEQSSQPQVHCSTVPLFHCSTGPLGFGGSTQRDCSESRLAMIESRLSSAADAVIEVRFKAKCLSTESPGPGGVPLLFAPESPQNQQKKTVVRSPHSVAFFNFPTNIPERAKNRQRASSSTASIG